MNNGGVNTFTSRRTNFLECEYWLVSKDERDKDKSQLTHEKAPEGEFYARIENSVENTSSVIAQTFLFDSQNLSISTTDYVEGLKKNCLVAIKNNPALEGVWRVDSLNKAPIRSNYQFDTDIQYRTYIQLRR